MDIVFFCRDAEEYLQAGKLFTDGVLGSPTMVIKVNGIKHLLTACDLSTNNFKVTLTLISEES